MLFKFIRILFVFWFLIFLIYFLQIMALVLNLPGSHTRLLLDFQRKYLFKCINNIISFIMLLLWIFYNTFLCCKKYCACIFFFSFFMILTFLKKNSPISSILCIISIFYLSASLMLIVSFDKSINKLYNVQNLSKKLKFSIQGLPA